MKSLIQAALVLGGLMAFSAPGAAQSHHVGESGAWTVERWGDLCTARLLRPENNGFLLRLDLARSPADGGAWSIQTDSAPDQDGEYNTTVDRRRFRTRAAREEQLTRIRVGPEVIGAIRTGNRLSLNFDAGGPEFLLQGAGRAIQLLEGCARDPSTSGPPLRPVRGGADWIGLSGGALAPSAEAAGRDTNGQPLFICVARHDGVSYPGKIREGFNGCNIAAGGREVTVTSYSIMLGGQNWRRVPGGRVPTDGSFPRPVFIGRDSNGAGMFHICRAEHRGGIQIGRSRLGAPGCVFSYGGAEVTSANFEVLLA